MSDTITTGFVPSLEAMPLAALAQRGRAWQMRPCPSFGRVIRYMLTGELLAGLLPWELGITELVSKPGQNGAWCASLVLHACPTELVLSNKAAKALNAAKAGGRGPSGRWVFGIEGRCSLTRYQILNWQLQVTGEPLEPPIFKVLPMELMRKGLESGTLDGIVAPTPWGMQVEKERKGRLDLRFQPGKYAQRLVLFCRKDAAVKFRDFLAHMPAQLALIHQWLKDEDAFARTAEYMASLGQPKCEPASLREAAERHLREVEQHDFHPDEVWLREEMRILGERVTLGEGTLAPAEMAESLICAD